MFFPCETWLRKCVETFNRRGTRNR